MEVKEALNFPHILQGIEEEIPSAAIEVEITREAEIQVKIEVSQVVLVEPVAAEAVGSELEAGSHEGVCEGRRG